MSTINPKDKVLIYQSLFNQLVSKDDPSTVAQHWIDMIKPKIKTSDIASMWTSCILLKLDELATICSNLFAEKLGEIMASDESIKSYNLDLVKLIVGSDMSIPEINLFKFVHKWIGLTSPLNDTVKELMQSIRFATMDTNDLIDIVKPTGILTLDAYTQALECSIKKTGPLPRGMSNIEFFINVGKEHTENGFREITEADITPKFAKCFAEYLSKHQSLKVLNLADTDKWSRFIRVGSHRLMVDNSFIEAAVGVFNKGDTCKLLVNDKINEVKLNPEPWSGFYAHVLFVKDNVKF